MGSVYETIDDELRAWIDRQPLFFVGTAPAAGGHVNVSPKGGEGTFRVLGPTRFAYVDLFGSGAETVAHLRDDGRIVVMFCAFDGRPRIVRLHGTGRVIVPSDPDHAADLAAFDLRDEQRRAARSIIDIEVTRVSDACGYVVPEMSLVAHRDQLYRSAEHRIRRDGPEAIGRLVAQRNAASIDGLPAFGP
jgi:hypothetical protein